MFSQALLESARALVDLLRQKHTMLVTAESCTGGLMAGLITEIPGASDAFERGFVTYSNAAKVGALNVDLSLIRRHGAVSAEVAEAMAAGALRASSAGLAVAVTGIAGPGGGTAQKPVGLVFIATCVRGAPPQAFEHRFPQPSRHEIRLAATAAAIAHLLAALERSECANGS